MEYEWLVLAELAGREGLVNERDRICLGRACVRLNLLSISMLLFLLALLTNQLKLSSAHFHTHT